MPIRALSVFWMAVGDFLRAWPRLLTADVIYKIIAFVLLAPLVSLTLKLFMASKGASVLADQDILFFILSPLGLTALVVVGAVSLAILALEQACLMAIGFAETRELQVRTTDALWFGTRRAWPVVMMTLRIFVRVLLIALPFLAASGLIYLLLLAEHDINYYLAQKPPVFLFAVGTVAVLLAVMAALIIRRLLSWSFALPLLLFEDAGPARSLTTSVERTKGHKQVVATTLVAWGVTATLLSALPLTVVGTIGRWTVPRFAGSMVMLVIVMGGFLLLWGILNLFVTLINAAMFALLTVRLYDSFGSSPDAELSGAKITEKLAAGHRRRISVKRALAALSVAAVLAAAVGLLFVASVKPVDEVVVIAHRGAAGSAPENTLASVALAVDQGADFVEIDVQESADGEVVVVHDSDLMRIGGAAIKIWEANTDELQKIDIGSWFGPEFSDQRMPTLEQVLEICKGRSRVVIELKYYGHNQRLEERVAEIVERAEMEDHIILMSLASDLVTSMKSVRPEWTVGLLTAKAVGNLTRSDADFLAVHVGIASHRFVRRAHAARKEVYVWTVNDKLNMSRMMSRGVDGIITDHPALAREVLEQRAEMSAAERLMLTAAFWIGLEPKEPAPERDAGSGTGG